MAECNAKRAQRVIYEIRPGTTNLGREYEAKILTLVALRCVRQNFENFWLGTNIKQVGDFDDVVLHIKESSKRPGFTFLIQLKYSIRSKEINLEDFLSTDKDDMDFSLYKYSKNFTELKTAVETKSSDEIVNQIDPNRTTFILYTNRPSKKHNCLEKASNNWFFLLNTGKDSKHLYKFDFKELGSKNSLENFDYCQNIRFFPNQTDMKKLNNLIEGELEKLTERLGANKSNIKNITEKFMVYIGDWAVCNLGERFYLTKADVICKLSQLFFFRFLADWGEERRDFDGGKIEIWKKVVDNKKITIINSDDKTVGFLRQWVDSEVNYYFDISGKSWSYVLSQDEKEAFYATEHGYEARLLNFIGNDRKVTLLDIYKCLCFCGKLPLLLKMETDEDIGNILEILKFSNYYFNAVVINQKSGVLPDLRISTKHFITLNDLTEEDRSEILKQPVSLQGRPSPNLRNLLDDSMSKLLTASDVIHILSDDFDIGYSYPEYLQLSENLINRSLSKIVFDNEVTQKIEDEIFLIEKQFPSNELSIFTDDNLTTHTEPVELKGNLMVGTEEQISEQMEKLKSRGKVIHRLKFYDKQHYEWRETYGSIEKLQRYWLNSEGDTYEPVPIDCSFAYCSNFWTKLEGGVNTDRKPNVSLLVAGPGMGKTTLMDIIAHQAPSDVWVIKVDLNEHRRYFQDMEDSDGGLTADDHLEYFSKKLLKKYGCSNIELAKAVFNKLKNENRILLLMDAFDEVAVGFKDEATEILRCLHKEGYSMWITTRPAMRTHLELIFNTLSITLKPFDEKDQESYLIRHFTKACISNIPNTRLNLENCSLLVKHFTKKLLIAARENFTDRYLAFVGIPLQIRLLAEEYENECANCIESEKIEEFGKIDIFYLFKQFIKKKNKIFYDKYKKDDSLKMFENHQRLFALKCVFSEGYLSPLNLDQQLRDYFQNESYTMQYIQKGGFIVIEKIGSGSKTTFNVRFAHRTFAEFLAAEWIAINIKSYGNEKEAAWSLVRRNINLFSRSSFEDNYKFLFEVFDRIVVKNEELHLAVINGNISQARERIASNSDCINARDECGRSILHMVVLYGYRGVLQSDVSDFLDQIPNDHPLWHLKDVSEYDPFYYSIGSNKLHIANKICEKASNPMVFGYIYLIEKPEYFEKCFQMNLTHLFKALLSYFSLTDILLRKVDKNEVVQTYCERSYCKDFRSYRFYSNFVEEHGLTTLSKLFPAIFYSDVKWFTDLRIAAAFGTEENVRTLVENGADVNHQDYEECSPLHYAVIHRRIENVKYLLSKRADKNLPGEENKTSLHFAVITDSLDPADMPWAEDERTEMVSLLLNDGADVNTRDLFERTPLHYAAEGYYEESVKLMILKNADVKATDRYAKTPLDYAVENGNTDVVKILFEAAEHDVNSNMDAFLRLAVLNGRIETLKLLFAYDVNLNLVDERGRTLLHLAAMEGHDDVVSLFLSKGIDANQKDNLGNTPLHLALNSKHQKTARILLPKYINNNIEDPQGNLDLHIAVKCCQKETVMMVLANGADINKQNFEKYTALHLSLLLDYVNIANTLIAEGADCNVANIGGNTPLSLAANKGYYKTVKQMLLKGAAANKADNFGNIPIHYALMSCHQRVIELLLAHTAGCSLDKIDEKTFQKISEYFADSQNMKDKGGDIILEIAVRFGRVKVVRLLLNESNVNTKDGGGQGLLHCALNYNSYIVKHNKHHKLKRGIFLFQVLFNKGIDCKAKDVNGETILHELAITAKFLCSSFFSVFQYTLFRTHFKKIVELLLKYGADINAKNDKGETAMDFVCYYGHRDVAFVFQCNKIKANNKERDEVIDLQFLNKLS